MEAHYIDKKRHNQAFYAEDALTFGKFTVTPGLRWDRNSHRSGRTDAAAWIHRNI